jgi:ATP-dependent DNA helicase RecG
MSRDDLIDLITRLQAGLAELGGVEAKRAGRQVPTDVAEALSAFSNTPGGGLILLGVDETRGFAVTGVEDVERTTARVAQICRDEMEPSLHPTIEAEEIDGQKVVTIEVPEVASAQRPCLIKSRGIVNGAFLRVAGSNRKLTQYEVGLMIANRGHSRHDLVAVPETTIADLDDDLVDALVRRVRSTRGSVLASADHETLLRNLGVLSSGAELTLAGLLALGRYPQRFFPQLDLTFAFFPVPEHEPLEDGTRFLDSASIDGPIPAMLDEAMNRISRNMRRRAVIHGQGRMDVPDYPEAALREALANAVMHRDYSPESHGAQVRIQMSPDRIEIENPGGLYGSVSKETLETGESMSSARNTSLAKLLEDVTTTGGRVVAENRGSGMRAMLKALRDARLSPPDFNDEVSRFTVRFTGATLLDQETVEWISGLGEAGLTDGQVAALALARTGTVLTNSLYRAAGGSDAPTATRELVDLRNRGLIVRTGVGHRASWRLGPGLGQPGTERMQLPGRLTGEGRVLQVRRLLQTGDKSTRELAEATGLGPQSIRNYLNVLRSEGVVESTSEKLRSPANRWRLVDPETVSGQQSLPMPG